MSEIAPILEEWYAQNGRDLPWRQTKDPYRIWLSEIILQQTRVVQGRDYYLRFLARFPDVATLARASEDEVLKLWQGLGYYSRARNLHAAAQEIQTRFGGLFPRAYADVRSLKGVGDYTAAAVCSFAFDAPFAVLDGNVFRVLSRLFDVDIPIDTGGGRRDFAALAQSLLDTHASSLYNQAIMDFGAIHCLPAQPLCATCPFADRCLALAADTVTLRPVKNGKAAVHDRWFNYLHLVCGQETLLHRRTSGDIWQGLYEFPLIESDRALSFEELEQTAEFRTLSAGTDLHLTHTAVRPKHQLSHQTIHATFYRIEIKAWPPMAAEYLRTDGTTLGDYAVSRLTERYLDAVK
ncbi:MAG: A/G-specific adenine glycosylase [Alistipes sp.]